MEQHKCITCGRLYPADAIECPGCGQPNEEYVDSEVRQSQKKCLPDDGLIWSIVVTVFCFFPTGLAAIIYSLKVDYFWFKGEKEYAKLLAEKARKYRKISVGILLGAILLVLIIGAMSRK